MKKVLIPIISILLLLLFTIAISAKTAEEWIDKGKEYEKNQDYGKALKMYENAIDENYKCKEAYFYISVLKLRQGSIKEALEYIDTCIKINPKYARGIMFKGLLLAIQRDFSQALDYADRALQIDINDAHLWYGKGLILNEKQEYNNAIICFDKALELDPNYIDAKTAKEQSISLSQSKSYYGDISYNRGNAGSNTGSSCITKEPFFITWSLQKEGNYLYIVGQVKNNSSKQMRSVYIKFNIYNKDNIQIDDTIDSVSNLEPYGIWQFKIFITKDDATSVKFTEITQYD